MEQVDWVGIITAIGALVTAIGVILASFWSYRSKQKAEAAEAKIVQVEGAVYTLGKAVDGRLTQLLSANAEAAHAKGVANGMQEQRDRDAGELHGG